jgi:hypothetical protein
MKKVRNSKAKRSTDAKDKSWVPGRKGQGGEGLSKGYGGSAGDGTGASGPESGQRTKAKDDAQAQKKRDADYSPSLPGREKIARVLR